MKYKVIKSVAHNFADSFASTLNYVADDYVLSYVARRAITTGQAELKVDLLSGSVVPSALAASPVDQAIAQRVCWFPKLLASQRIDAAVVKEAIMCVRVDTSRCSEPKPYYNYRTAELPVEIQVIITDDRGV